MTKEERLAKGLEFIESGLYNLDNNRKFGEGFIQMAIEQISNGRKLIADELTQEEIDNIFGV